MMLRVSQRPMRGLLAPPFTVQRPAMALAVLSSSSARAMSKLVFRPSLAPSSSSSRIGLRIHNSVSRERTLMNQQRVRAISDFAALKQQRRAKRSADHMILGLVLANVAVYFGWQKVQRYPPMQQKMLEHFTTSASHLEQGRYHTLLTSVFSHGDLGHLFANMVGLYFFGTPICALLGKRRFLGIYLGSGILSSWATVYDQQRSDRLAFNFGASGAVNSVTAMSILLNPLATLYIFGVVPLPAFVTGTLFIGRDLYGWAMDRQDGVGHFAHLTGALCGGAYFGYLRYVKKAIL